MVRDLPVEAQFSDINGIQCADLNGDNYMDIMTIGNSLSEETITGWYDASYGNILIGDGRFNFSAPLPSQTGFIVEGDSKALSSVELGTGDRIWIATRNNGPVKIFKEIENRGKAFRLNKEDWYSMITLSDGSRRKQEFYYGEGYLSQNTRNLWVPHNAKCVEIFSFNGRKRTIKDP